MENRVVCNEMGCVECRDIVVGTYRDMREAGDTDRDAFLFLVDLLELRHPGHEHYYYFRCVARLLGARFCESIGNSK